jgi:tetratricopeptide (TPR) repeat protein
MSILQNGRAQDNGPILQTNSVVIEIENVVEIQRAGSKVWDTGRTNQLLYAGDQLRTGERSRAVVRMSPLNVLRIGELSVLQMPAVENGRPLGPKFFKGVLYFFHRDAPGSFEIRTPTVSALVRGTEFQLNVDEDQKSTLALFDGKVTLSNELGQINIESNQRAIASVGGPPKASALLQADTQELIQWCLYYPGILNPDELKLPEETERILDSSLTAYRAGDLLSALSNYPRDRQPDSSPERIYRASLWLAVGKVDDVKRELDGLATSDTSELTRSLLKGFLKILAAVHFQKIEENSNGTNRFTSSTEWLADSYYQQSQIDLPEALAAARRAVELAPQFSFGWARVSELEFSLGHTKAAKTAVEKSLELAPRNAQALALKGFMLAADNRIADALSLFNAAIAVDGSLGNGWLGRGLCLIRLNRREEGLQSIQMAVVMEPQRGFFRSYLGKAFSHNGHDEQSIHELGLAKGLDPQDPTAWLYSALILQQKNRINEAVGDLEEAQQLIVNRRIVRSTQLLDEDRAVAGANLAGIYEDAGMEQVAIREASKAVTADYAHYRSHLFLADSYSALLDPQQINLRYETPALNEYLIANLLAPVGAGPLSPLLSQQEYTRLFEANHLGITSSTDYRSGGDWLQTAAHYGTLGNISYLVGGIYRSHNGDSINSHQEQWSTSFEFKDQFTSQDSLFIEFETFHSRVGDVAQYYDPEMTDANLRVTEKQLPLLVAGYHRSWSPSSHTLFLTGNFRDNQAVNDPDSPQLILLKDNIGNIIAAPLALQPGASASPPRSALDYQNEFSGYSAELQQIIQVQNHTLIGGVRYQLGTFDTTDSLGGSTPTLLANSTTVSSVGISSPPIRNDFETDFNRLSLYAYDNWRIVDPLIVSLGLSFDEQYYPENFRNPPVTGNQIRTDKWSPKGGITWKPVDAATLRAGYTRQLGGVGFDQSFRLEPTQVAGFNQSLRSAIPESVVGSLAGEDFDIWSVAFDQRFSTRTYFGITGELLDSKVDRHLGAVDVTGISPPLFTSSVTPQKLKYSERTLLITINQLLGKYLSLGVAYRLSRAELESELEEISSIVTTANKSDVEAVLQQLTLTSIFNHSSGFFAELDGVWTEQTNHGYSPDLQGDDFWQFNAATGYRFPRRTAEIRLALLNITSQDYRLNPLNLRNETPRERTFEASLRFSF